TRVWGIIFQRMVLDAFAGVQFLLQGKIAHFFAILKAHFSFYGMLPRFLNKRKEHASKLPYYSIKSIVWKYFIVKKRNFNEL
ncbi:MAG: glycosyltransferase family 2 protein, partial [Bacteroidota bacterium]